MLTALTSMEDKHKGDDMDYAYLKAKPTRYNGLHFFKGPGYWSFADFDHAPIGPHYPTRAELLADMSRFAEERGFELA